MANTGKLYADFLSTAEPLLCRVDVIANRTQTIVQITRATRLFVIRNDIHTAGCICHIFYDFRIRIPPAIMGAIQGAVILRRNRQQKQIQNPDPNAEIEPYDADYSPIGSRRRNEPEPRRSRRESGGCFQYFMVIALSALILAGLGTSVFLYGIYKTGGTTNSPF